MPKVAPVKYPIGAFTGALRAALVCVMKSKFTGIKTAAEYKRGELAKNILRLVAAGLEVGATTAAAPNTLQLIDYLDPKGRYQRNRIWKTIKYLESKNRIELTEDKGHTYVTLTELGKVHFDEESIQEMQIANPRRWDKKWRLILFDLPSKHEKVRQSFRRKLEDFGLIMYQRSVFIYPHECREEVQAVAEWYGVQHCVRYIVATEINDIRFFAKRFDLL